MKINKAELLYSKQSVNGSWYEGDDANEEENNDDTQNKELCFTTGKILPLGKKKLNVCLTWSIFLSEWEFKYVNTHLTMYI